MILAHGKLILYLVCYLRDRSYHISSFSSRLCVSQIPDAMCAMIVVNVGILAGDVDLSLICAGEDSVLACRDDNILVTTARCAWIEG